MSRSKKLLWLSLLFAVLDISVYCLPRQDRTVEDSDISEPHPDNTTPSADIFNSTLPSTTPLSDYHEELQLAGEVINKSFNKTYHALDRRK